MEKCGLFIIFKDTHVLARWSEYLKGHEEGRIAHSLITFEKYADCLKVISKINQDSPFILSTTSEGGRGTDIVSPLPTHVIIGFKPESHA